MPGTCNALRHTPNKRACTCRRTSQPNILQHLDSQLSAATVAKWVKSARADPSKWMRPQRATGQCSARKASRLWPPSERCLQVLSTNCVKGGGGDAVVKPIRTWQVWHLSRQLQTAQASTCEHPKLGANASIKPNSVQFCSSSVALLMRRPATAHVMVRKATKHCWHNLMRVTVRKGPSTVSKSSCEPRPSIDPTAWTTVQHRLSRDASRSAQGTPMAAWSTMPCPTKIERSNSMWPKQSPKHLLESRAGLLRA